MADLKIDAKVDPTLDLGTGEPDLTATHPAGKSISAGGFRIDARTPPKSWEVVSRNLEWRDYC